jgi:uncharacterized protein YegP (UPF0339 family)
MMTRYVVIIKRTWLKQKWYARFVADNGKILAITEHYHNLKDLEDMLAEYFPDWDVEKPPVIE